MNSQTIRTIIPVLTWVLLAFPAGCTTQGRPGPQTPDPSTPEQAARIKGYLQEMEPSGFQTLTALEQGTKSPDAEVRRKHEQKLAVFLTKASQRMDYAEDVRKNRPEEYKRLLKQRDLDRTCLEFAARIRTIQDEKVKAELKTRLKKILYDLFELREQARAAEIEALQKRVQELQSGTDKRKNNRDRIVEGRLQDLIGEPTEDMEW